MKYVVTLAIAAVVASFASAEDFKFAGMSGKIPADWKEEKPTSTMREAQFKLPRVKGDDADAELAFFKLKGSGTLEANLERQVNKFAKVEGKPATSSVTKINVGKIEASYQDVKGTYLSKFPPFAPNAKITEMPNFRQLYVVFKTEDADYYMTLLGPAKTIESHKKGFEEFLKSFK